MQTTDFSRQISSFSMSLPPVKIVVIDAGFGNIASVLNALEALGANACLSRDPAMLRAADGLILPGVGAFADGMRQLRTLNLLSVLKEVAIEQKKPFLGICLGMQLLAKRGDEGGECDGLGWIDADVIRFEPSVMNGKALKIPHVGWNDVRTVRQDPILGTEGSNNAYYFVHSYHLRMNEPDNIVGVCDYGASFPAAIRKGNIWGMQFHPEKSHRAGLRLLANFVGQAAERLSGNQKSPTSQQT